MADFSRTEMLIGSESMQKLANAKVLVCGVGGVGGFCVEALARSGVGTIGLVDNDIVSESNVNRQIIALSSTVGRKKVDVMRGRIKDINADAKVCVYDTFILTDNIDEIEISKYDCVIDCVDTVTAKLAIIVKAKELGKYVVSSMGTGNKLDPTKFAMMDISKTTVCPLAAVMRRELKSRGIKNVTVLSSTETPRIPIERNADDAKEAVGGTVPTTRRRSPTPSSISFTPAIAGLLIAGDVIKKIIGE